MVVLVTILGVLAELVSVQMAVLVQVVLVQVDNINIRIVVVEDDTRLIVSM